MQVAVNDSNYYEMINGGQKLIGRARLATLVHLPHRGGSGCARDLIVSFMRRTASSGSPATPR
jgi:hypothetical protein